MHDTVLGIIALVFAALLFINKKRYAGLGFLVIALVLGFSFFIYIKTLPVDAIGVILTLFFAFGCFMVFYELRKDSGENN
ncbi:MAG: hypothetical protein HY776_03700 [Actinobacteria bacterium]|nr:hypothetical protein [Actinomycetota bacterium]